MASLLIIFRAVLSASASGLQKHLLTLGAGSMRVWFGTYALMLLPCGLLSLPGSIRMPAAFWLYGLLGGTLDAIGNVAMVKALRGTDLSIFGPLNGLRAILALIFGWIFLGESPTRMGGLGVLLTIVGTVLVFRRPGHRQDLSPVNSEMRQILFWRVAGLSFSVAAAAFPKRAALIGPTSLTLTVWTVCALASVLLAMSLFGQAGDLFRLNGTLIADRWLWLHAVVFFGLQWLTIRIFQTTLLSYSFAYFQLAMVFQVVLGRVVFKESAFGPRLGGCLIIAAGSALIAWKG